MDEIDQLLAEQPRYVSKEFAAAVLNLSARTLDYLHRSNEGPRRYKNGRQVQYLLDDVRAYRDALILKKQG